MHKQGYSPYRNKYSFDGVEYAPLMYTKTIMSLATIDSVTPPQTLCDNLQLLGVLRQLLVWQAAQHFWQKLLTNDCQGATIDDPIGILFDTYIGVPCNNFKSYICRQHKDYLNGKLTAITHEALMTSAKCKFNWLKIKTNGMWGAKSPDDKDWFSSCVDQYYMLLYQIKHF